MAARRVIQTFKPSHEWHNSPPGLGDFIRGTCHLHAILNQTGVELRVDMSRTGFAGLIVQDPALFVAGDPERIAQAEEYFSDHAAMRHRLQAFVLSDEPELYLCTNAGAWNCMQLPERTHAAMQAFYRFTPDVEDALAQALPVQDYEVLSIRCGDRFYGADGRPDQGMLQTLCRLVEHDVLPATRHPLVVTSDCHQLKLDLASRYGLLMLSHRSRHGAFDDQVMPVAVDMGLLRHSKANHHINAWARWWSGFSHYTSMLAGVGGLNFRVPAFECEAFSADGGVAVSHAIGAAPSLTTAASDALARDNLALADHLWRKAIERHPGHTQAMCELGRMAMRLRRSEIAGHLFGRAAALRPDDEQARAWLADARAATAARPAAIAAAPHKLSLITVCGGTFWDDVDHVLGQLLVADLTGRTPVVHWGRRSRFASAADADANAFEQFFEPVSDATLAGACSAARNFFPAGWTPDRLHDDRPTPGTGPGPHLSHLHLLARDEDVVVADFDVRVVDLLPWIESNSDHHGLDLVATCRRLAARYLRLRAPLRARVEAIEREQMIGRRWIAVHVPGEDAPGSTRVLGPLHAPVHERVSARLASDPEAGLLILTDSQAVADDFRTRHRVPAIVRIVGRGAPREAGEAEAIDGFLAARCEAFVGSGASPLSAAVRSLKPWRHDAFELVGPDTSAVRCQRQHRW